MAVAKKIQIYDTTLRDGCQSEDVSLTTADKLQIAERLDDLGIDYIEGGWPGSNARDAAFFTEVKRLKLRHAKIAAFGSTRRAGIRAAADRNLQLILQADTPVATVVGKTWDLHVREALRISLPANLEILNDTIAYLKKHVDEVIFDAEHFFDGYRANPEFAIACIKAVDDAGVDLVCLCDTNGGRMPWEIEDAVKAAIAAMRAPVGIHCHNDSEVAVANSLAAIRSGAIQVQGTINGLGERCGNANLVSIIGNLQLKLGYSCVPNAKLKSMQETSMLVYELANITPNRRQAYVGQSAFAHKAGLHVSGIQRNVHTYEHVDPALLGNDRRVLLSELSGRANILYKTREFGIESELTKEQIALLLEELKRLEAAGYTFDGADASFELLILRTLGRARDHFNFISFRVFDDKWHEDQAPFSEAVIVMEGPDGKRTRNAAIGNGPVNALDSALRQALVPYYPSLANMQLADYKVRVLDNGAGTGARVRVLIESTDGRNRWGTVGLSSNVVEASWQALVDSVEFKLHKDNVKPRIPATVSANGTGRLVNGTANGKLSAAANSKLNAAPNGKLNAAANGKINPAASDARRLTNGTANGKLNAGASDARRLVNGTARAKVNAAANDPRRLVNGTARAKLNAAASDARRLVNGTANGKVNPAANSKLNTAASEARRLTNGTARARANATANDGRRPVNGTVHAKANGKLNAAANGKLNAGPRIQAAVSANDPRRVVNGTVHAKVNAAANGNLNAGPRIQAAVSANDPRRLVNGTARAKVNAAANDGRRPVNGAVHAKANGKLKAAVNGKINAAMNGKLIAVVKKRRAATGLGGTVAAKP